MSLEKKPFNNENNSNAISASVEKVKPSNEINIREALSSLNLQKTLDIGSKVGILFKKNIFIKNEENI